MRDTWTRARAVLAVAVEKCGTCKGHGGYWFATKWRVCESCDGSGSA